jgi:hypothetical protein
MPMLSALDKDDDDFVNAGREVLTLLQGLTDQSQAPPSATSTAAGGSSANQTTPSGNIPRWELPKLPAGVSEDTLREYGRTLQEYSPGLQMVALKFGNELFRIGAYRMRQATRPEVSFPLPPLPTLPFQAANGPDDIRK